MNKVKFELIDDVDSNSKIEIKEGIDFIAIGSSQVNYPYEDVWVELYKEQAVILVNEINRIIKMGKLK